MNRSTVNSFVTMLLICANPIAWIGSGGMLPIICFLCLTILLINNRCIVRITIPLFVYATFMFVISAQLKENTANNEYFSSYWITFFTLGITGFICGGIKRNINLVFKDIAIFGVIFVPFVLRLDMGSPLEGTSDYGHWMGVSYGLIKIINAIIITIVFFTKRKVYKMILIISLIVYIAFLLVYGSRGALLAMLGEIFFVWIIKRGFSKNEVFKVMLKIAIPLLLLTVFFFEILEVINNITETMGFNLFFVEKMLRFHELGDSFSNGRDTLFANGIDGIINSPIWGNGIATFEPYNDGYVHNVFIQIFYELGIIPFIIFCASLGYALLYIIDNKNDISNRIFFSYLISVGIIELLFSSSYWLSQVFWLFISFSYYTYRIKTKMSHAIENISTAI